MIFIVLGKIGCHRLSFESNQEDQVQATKSVEPVLKSLFISHVSTNQSYCVTSIDQDE